MIVFDTNVISEIFKPRPNARVVALLEAPGEEVAITSVTLAELLAGVRRLPEGRRKEELQIALNAAVGPYRQSGAILAFDDAAAEQYAEVLSRREREGLPISTADAQIAAICRAHRAACATRNVKDFACTGVRVIDPWAD
ncbi:type II toxin-antitoxin system VapC family toxin [Rothia sp. AR01]|uniref:Ribonuclease VapC n=1 Tax=Rothia santali TaxID=2949643 RepID=A0A9X2H8R2_9MICC|nr:type II toxin-antitoxin system VapC family toxin [Rothia santali]MCP3424791.1 type II toxin-antitoxin system VapC family toxin [Rothia santali]